MNNKALGNNLKIQFSLFFIKGLKLLGFGRSVFKKILYKILKSIIGEESFLNIMVTFCLYPLLNSTDSKMIVSSRVIDGRELGYLKNMESMKTLYF